MADLFEREERFTVVPNDLAVVEAAVRALVGRNTMKN
jgi:threonine synthase